MSAPAYRMVARTLALRRLSTALRVVLALWIAFYVPRIRLSLALASPKMAHVRTGNIFRSAHMRSFLRMSTVISASE